VDYNTNSQASFLKFIFDGGFNHSALVLICALRFAFVFKIDILAPDAGWSSLVARQAHNLKAAGSNPAPATNLLAASTRLRKVQAAQFERGKQSSVAQW
jgi:hypothetical protein